MFNNKLVKKIDELIKSLKEDNSNELILLHNQKKKLEEEVEQLKLKKKISEEDIKHMVRLKEEKNAVENERKMMEMERKLAKDLEKAHKDYRDKTEKMLQKQVGDIKEMYGQILERLPNIGVELTGGAKGKK